MKENTGNAWIGMMQERLEKKNITPEELCMIEDFTTSLYVIQAFNADPENPLVNFHLNRAKHIINHFTNQEE